jgi:tetratricopeptide (TPR) repeat protein
MKTWITCLLLLVLLALQTASPAKASASGAAGTYLILPFENIGEDPSLGWLSTCMSFSLGEYLVGLGAQVIDDEERAVLFEGSGLPPGAPLMLASALELGRKMHSRNSASRPDRLVVGRFLVTDGALEISARSIDLETEKAERWVEQDGRLIDLLKLHNRLALALADEDGLEIPGTRSTMLQKHAGDVPLLAFETYCRAMAETVPKKRLQLLKRAVRERPGYPKAIYQAARLLVQSERWSEAAEMLDGASAVPHPYEAAFHLLSATVALERDAPDAAVTAARRALEIVESSRGHLLLARAHLAQGDRDAARGELRAAEALDASDPALADVRRQLSEQPDP